MSRRQRYALIVGLYGLFLLATFPAHWVGEILARHSSIRLIAAEGTLWQGRSAALQIRQHTFPHFSWQLRALPLLWGSLQGELRWADHSHTRMSATLNQWQLQQTDVRFPVAWLSEFLPDAKVYGLEGELRLQSGQLTWRDKLDGKANLTWYNAGTVKLAVHPLGDYQLDIQADDKGIVSHIRTQQGALTITGTLRRPDGDRLRFSGTLKPDPARQAEFGELSQLTSGQADAQGAFHLGF